VGALAIVLVAGSARAEAPAPAAPLIVAPPAPVPAVLIGPRVPEPGDGVPVWPVAGALTALVPFAAGSLLIADDGRPDRQRLGTYILAAGLATAPWVAHVGAGRPRRALVFGLTSLGLSAALVASMQWRDPYDVTIANHDRAPFSIILGTTVLAAVLGVVDGFLLAPGNGEPR
jgi:hypothetical protein